MFLMGEKKKKNITRQNFMSRKINVQYGKRNRFIWEDVLIKLVIEATCKEEILVFVFSM